MDGDEAGCLLIPRFPLACELAERPELRRAPAVVTGPGHEVWAASPAAERQGIRPGQPLREALGRLPALAVLEGRPALYRAQGEAILDALERLAPGVEPAAEGVVHIDLRGLRACHPDAQALWSALLGCVPAALEPRLGVGPGTFAALVAASTAGPRQASVIAAGDARRALAPHPAELLPVPAEMLRRLRLLGVTTLGGVGMIPRGALTAQFGPDGARAHRLARAEERPPVRPRPWQERVVERMDFEEPLTSLDALLAALEQAASRAFRQPALRGRAVRQLSLSLTTERGHLWAHVITSKEALGGRERAAALLRPPLAGAELPGAISGLTLELGSLTEARGWQRDLFPARAQRRERLEEGLRHLKARYGHCPVSRIVTVEPWSRIPERRAALIDFDP